MLFQSEKPSRLKIGTQGFVGESVFTFPYHSFLNIFGKSIIDKFFAQFNLSHIFGADQDFHGCLVK